MEYLWHGSVKLEGRLSSRWRVMDERDGVLGLRFFAPSWRCCLWRHWDKATHLNVSIRQEGKRIFFLSHLLDQQIFLVYRSTKFSQCYSFLFSSLRSTIERKRETAVYLLLQQCPLFILQTVNNFVRGVFLAETHRPLVVDPEVGRLEDEKARKWPTSTGFRDSLRKRGFKREWEIKMKV